ncbi:DUF2071 domain-containing protein [Nonomuraea sp. K274]|uniref:DUF2071 domain-containing protein n=1 Tax=Nonomuraea cypriaca TaxID=1187855 RepID=A0A931EVK4_9ACTN|nr:DUF2071 domain-containing protein [Nonomuraea cypriaca]MBF8185749.1 DUF2071 domain-containing protein [Nonomuraea cypriaca]
MAGQWPGVRAPPSAEVTWPVMYHRWSKMTFIHWRYPPALVQSLLPDFLTVESYDGDAWIGLTPFLMEGVRVPFTPAAPCLSRFPETNLRTYVRDARGRSGLWFLSLDAGSLPAALGGRTGYGLPYFWSDMSVSDDGTLTRYTSRRRLPGPCGARCDVTAETGSPLAEGECDELAHFLTARFRLFTRVAGRPASAAVEHPPWPLHRTRLAHLDQDLLQSAGLPAPDRPPVVHASPGVQVRVGMWRW